MFSLSSPAQKIINQYLTLPFPHKQVVCPYLNNRRAGVKAGLRALIGKGTPTEIVEEANIMALKEKIKLADLDDINLKKFLIDHKLGIDCSGLVYHILDAELQARNLGGLKKHLKFSQQNPFRKLLTWLRPAENASVKVFANSLNSQVINWQSTMPGDLIIMLNTGENKDRDHIILITDVEKINNPISQLRYLHSFSWSSEGNTEHGVRTGEIEITDLNGSLLAQKWVEKNKTDEENETLKHVKTATKFEIRRLNFLSI